VHGKKSNTEKARGTVPTVDIQKRSVTTATFPQFACRHCTSTAERSCCRALPTRVHRCRIQQDGRGFSREVKAAGCEVPGFLID
jgi:hypothetical protein